MDDTGRGREPGAVWLGVIAAIQHQRPSLHSRPPRETSAFRTSGIAPVQPDCHMMSAMVSSKETRSPQESGARVGRADGRRNPQRGQRRPGTARRPGRPRRRARAGPYHDPLGGHRSCSSRCPSIGSSRRRTSAISDTHVKRLWPSSRRSAASSIRSSPSAHDDGYWTPNGNHRLPALKKLGVRTVVALLVPEPEVAFRILALNTEKAHNLREKSLETIRMARELAGARGRGARGESSRSSSSSRRS